MKEFDLARKAFSRSDGVALILVLMITGVTGLLILGIGLGAQGQVERAKALVDRANASFAVRSDEAELAFALLTTDWVRPTDAESTPESPVYPRPDWNFRGKDFSLNGARVKIQDPQGLFVMPQQPDGAAGLEVLFTRFLGMPESRASDAARRFRQDMADPSWVALQSLHDLQFLGLITADERKRLEPFTTVTPTLAFNPLSVPDELMDVWFQDSTKAGLLELRERGDLNTESYIRVTGSDPVSLSFYPGPNLEVQVSRTVGKTTVTRGAHWLIAPYDSEPLRVVARRQFATPG
jgi:hypothetical protein